MSAALTTSWGFPVPTLTTSAVSLMPGCAFLAPVIGIVSRPMLRVLFGGGGFEDVAADVSSDFDKQPPMLQVKHW